MTRSSQPFIFAAILDTFGGNIELSLSTPTIIIIHHASKHHNATMAAPSSHLEAFIDDNFVLQCSRAQRRQFLKTGTVPKVSQRVDLTVLVSTQELSDRPFRLSGEVVAVQPSPTWNVSGENISAVLSRVTYWRPSSSPDDYGPSRGSSVLAYIVKKKLPKGRYKHDGSHPSLAEIYGRLPLWQKQEYRTLALQKFGALHGQQVIVEGR